MVKEVEIFSKMCENNYYQRNFYEFVKFWLIYAEFIAITSFGELLNN